MSGDLKTFFDKAAYPDQGDLSGDVATTRGTDPNAAGGDGPAGLTDFWPKRALPESLNEGMAESANSVSGLPALPNRFGPAAETVEPPDLTDRSPGTIDKS